MISQRHCYFSLFLFKNFSALSSRVITIILLCASLSSELLKIRFKYLLYCSLFIIWFLFLFLLLNFLFVI